MNLTFCGPPPGETSIEYWYNWPVSQWATRLKASFDGFGYVQAGVYEANPRYLLKRNGLNLGEPGGASVNSRVSAAEKISGKPVLTSEYVGELFYSARLAHWIELRPGIQFIHQRGALARNEDQVIVGMRVSARL